MKVIVFLLTLCGFLAALYLTPLGFNSDSPILGLGAGSLALLTFISLIYQIRKYMRYRNMFLVLIGLILFSSCERVEISYEGVLVTNYGRNFPDDYEVVTGKVTTAAWGTSLYQIPTHEVREDLAAFSVQSKGNITFKVDPKYSFQVTRGSAKHLIYENARFKDNDNFLLAIADNVLEPRIVEAYQTVATEYPTDSLMNNTGAYNQAVRERLMDEFAELHITLEAISCVLEPPAALKKESELRGSATIIAQRKEVELRAALANQEIKLSDARAEIELAKLEAQANKIRSASLTPELLRDREVGLFYAKWNGEAIQYPENMPLINR